MPLLLSAESGELAVVREVESNQQLIRSAGPTLRHIDAFATTLSGSDDRALILERTRSWAAELYSKWTTLSEDANKEEHVSSDSNADAVYTADEGETTSVLKELTTEIPPPRLHATAPEPLELQQTALEISFENGPLQGDGHARRGTCAIAFEQCCPSPNPYSKRS